MLFRFFTVLFLLTAAAHAETSVAPTCVASTNSCEFYACQERQQPCGGSGYWISFGQYYCQSFLDSEARFLPQTQVWLQNVRHCLQAELQNTTQNLSCDQIHSFAVESHVACYRNTGFCELPASEKIWIYWYLRGAAWDPLTWVQALKIQQICVAP